MSPAELTAQRQHVVHEFTVERIETIVMTAERYEQAVTALATLVVEWETSPATTMARLIIQARADQPRPGMHPAHRSNESTR